MLDVLLLVSLTLRMFNSDREGLDVDVQELDRKDVEFSKLFRLENQCVRYDSAGPTNDSNILIPSLIPSLIPAHNPNPDGPTSSLKPVSR
jgi:hypothetical protein